MERKGTLDLALRRLAFASIFAAALLLPSLHAVVDPFTCSQSQFDQVLQACGIACVAMFALIALVYIGGEALQSPRMLTWAKTESMQAFASLVIASLVLFALSTMCSFQVGEISLFTGEPMPQIYKDTNPSGSDNLYNGAMRYVENLAAVSLSNINSLRYDLGAYEIRTSYSKFVCKGSCVYSLTSQSLSVFGGESAALGITNNLLAVGTVTYLSALFMYFTLVYIYGGLFLVMLPIAIIVRSIPFMRQLGGALVAIFVALYLLYPIMLVADAYIAPGLASGSEVTMCDRDGRDCAGYKIFQVDGSDSPVQCNTDPPCNNRKEWQMEGVGITETDMAKLAPNTISGAVQLNVLLFMSSVFLAALNFIVIAAFGRELSRFLGEEADISRLGQMI